MARASGSGHDVVEITVEIDEAAFREFVTGFEFREGLEALGSAFLSRAIAKTGIDTGRLRRSMYFDVVDTDDGLAVEFGSKDAETGEMVPYAIHHWAPGKPGGHRAKWPGTRPWTRTARELGFEVEAKRGYPI